MEAINIIDFCDQNGIAWFPIQLKIIINEDGTRSKKLITRKDNECLLPYTPSKKYFTEWSETKIKKKQKLIELTDHIAIDCNKYQHLDVDFKESKYDSYNEESKQFVADFMKDKPYFKSSTKKYGKHIFFQTDYDCNNDKPESKYQDCEFLMKGNWSYAPKDTLVFNPIVPPKVENEVIASYIANKSKHDKTKEKTKKEKTTNTNTTINENNKKLDTDYAELQQIGNLISVEYLDDYNDWLRIIWALKSIDIELKDYAETLSKKSVKYKKDSFEEYWEKGRIGRLGIGTIYHYAKQSDEANYNTIRLMNFKNKSQDYISSDDTLAEIFLNGNVGNYIYKDEIVYTYFKNRWYEDKKKEKMKYNISKDLYKLLLQKTINLKHKEMNFNKELLCIEEEDQENNIKDKIKKIKEEMKFYEKLINNVKSSKKTNSITDKVIQHLSVRDFDNIKFDNNPYYFCFKNKVYDFENKMWISPKREDYILTYLDYNYTPSSKQQKEKLKELIKTIFPKEEIRNNYLHYLCLGLIGVVLEKFIVANGSGGNGKGVINELMLALLGIYGFVGNNSVLLQPMKGGGLPEVANMDKKRFVIFREPAEGGGNKKLQLSIIKELCGGNSISARKLYSNDTEVSLCAVYVLECNDKPQMEGRLDHAIVRRLSDIPFVSTFTTEEKEYNDPNCKNTFKADEYYKTKEFQEEYKCVFFDILLEWILKYEETSQMKFWNNFTDCDIVKKRTMEYIQESDEKLKWIEDNYIYTGSSEEYEKLEDIMIGFKQSDIYLNMTKQEKRAFGKKGFYNYIETNLKLRKYYNERIFIDGKSRRNILLGWREKTDEEKEEQ
jgi:phage/plasmid-associated DNA primase